MSVDDKTGTLGDNMDVARSKVPAAAPGASAAPNDSVPAAIPDPDSARTLSSGASALASGSAALAPSTAADRTLSTGTGTPLGAETPASPSSPSGSTPQTTSTLSTQSQPNPQPQACRASPRPISVSAGSGIPRARPASALVSSGLGTSTPKPRSNSSLQSSRPAPPSPANSRPPSQILSSPGLSPHVSPRASAGGLVGLGLAGSSACASGSGSGSGGPSTPVGGVSGRDRAGSASSASATRRVRPRSTLGTSSLVPPSQEAAELATVSKPTTPRNEGEVAAEPIREVSESEDADNTQDDTSQCFKSPVMALAATLVRRVIVRDYAYPSDDERFLGLGPNRPRSNWCEGEPEPEDPPAAEQKSGWGGLSFGGLGLGGFLGWRPPATEEHDTTDYTLASDTAADHDNDSYWSDDDFDDAADEADPDGLYRAAFAFEPEGVNEMAVEAGDLVDVRGRGGGGDGWVVAIRLDTNEEGLVPEGYLERVEEEECPEGWDHIRKERAASEERRERDGQAQPEEEVLIETRERVGKLALDGRQ